MRIFFIVLLMASMITSCHNDQPANLLPGDTYVNLLIELQLLESYGDQQHPGSQIVDSLRQIIFKKYGTTKQQFQKSNIYYSQHIDQQNKRIQEAIDRLRKDHISSQDSLKKRKDDSTATDFVKWNFPPFNFPKIPFTYPEETHPGASPQDSNFPKVPFKHP
jgi:hypothetical protein